LTLQADFFIFSDVGKKYMVFLLQLKITINSRLMQKTGNIYPKYNNRSLAAVELIGKRKKVSLFFRRQQLPGRTLYFVPPENDR
jgi:hypothetical protein